MHLTLFLTHL